MRRPSRAMNPLIKNPRLRRVISGLTDEQLAIDLDFFRRPRQAASYRSLLTVLENEVKKRKGRRRRAVNKR